MKILGLIMMVFAILILAGCGTGPSSSTPPATSSAVPSGTDPSGTYQAMATTGQTVYGSTCSSCHGANGEGGIGPALWGAKFVPGTYNGLVLFKNNAQDMLSFISSKMPLNAPASLTHQQYLQVLAYLLIQEKLVSPTDQFNESQLGSITVK